MLDQIDDICRAIFAPRRSRLSRLPRRLRAPRPGLVGSHALASYYLSHLAGQFCHNPQMILSGRDTNDDMRIRSPTRCTRCGAVSRESARPWSNLQAKRPDLRNSRSFDLIDRLKRFGYEVGAAEPIADPAELKAEHASEWRL